MVKLNNKNNMKGCRVMFCWNCKAQLNDDAKFCFSCGSPVQGEKDSIQVSPSNEPAPELELTRIMPEKPSENMTIPNQFNTQDSYAPMPQVIQPSPTPAVINNINPNGKELQQSAFSEPDIKKSSEQEIKKPEKKHKSPFVKFVFSFLFGILILALSLVVSLGLCIRTTLSNNEISKEISSSDMSDIVIGDIITETELNDILTDNNVITGSVNRKDTISDLISDNTEFSSKKAKKLLNNSFLTKYIGDAIFEYEEYILNNVESDFFSGENIYEFIEENIDEISEMAGMQFYIYENELSSITDEMDKQISSIAPQEILDEKGSLTSLFLSPVILISISVLALIFIILILITTSDISSALLTSGICAVINGGVLVFASGLRNMIFEIAGLDFNIFTDYISDVLKNTLCARFEKNGLIILIAGVAFIVISILIKVISSALRKNKTV